MNDLERSDSTRFFWAKFEYEADRRKRTAKDSEKSCLSRSILYPVTIEDKLGANQESMTLAPNVYKCLTLFNLQSIRALFEVLK